MESEGIVVSSGATDDIFNDARYIFQSQDNSFYQHPDNKIIYSSSPEQPGGIFVASSHGVL